MMERHQIPGDVGEARRSRAGAQELVGAAHGQLGAGAVQIQVQDPDRVAQVPDHERAGGGRPSGLGRDVGHLGRAVVDDRADGHGDVVESVVVRSHLEPELAGDAVGDVAVRRELVRVDGDDGAGGTQLEGGVQQLVEVHRDRVVDHDLVTVDAEQPGQHRPRLERELEPTVVPGPDQPARPLLGDDALDLVHGPAGRSAQRVAVQVHEGRVRDDELVAPGGERVRSVERHRVVPRDHRRSLT
jgi:hypothetical protein